MCGETEEIGDTFARQGKPPYPGVVGSGVVEAVVRIFPLLLGERCASARGDGKTGIVGGLGVGFLGFRLGPRIGECCTPFEPCTGLHSVDECQADGVLVRCGIIFKQLLRHVEIWEYDLVVDVIHFCPRVVLGLSLGCLREYDRHAEAEQ